MVMYSAESGTQLLYPGLGIICGSSSLLVLILSPRAISVGTPDFPSPQKPTFPNSNLNWIVIKHLKQNNSLPLAQEIVQALPVLLILNKITSLRHSTLNYL